MTKALSIILASLIFTSCASTYQYSKVSGKTTPPEKATICVIRNSSFAWSADFRIYQDETLIGKLGPKSYLMWDVVPDGKEVAIVSKLENKDVVFIKPEPGKIYYIKQTPKVGLAAARTKLEIIDEQEGKRHVYLLKPPKSKKPKQTK